MSISLPALYQRLASRIVGGLGLALLSISPAMAEYGLTFQTPVSPIGDRLYELHHLVFYICVVIFVIVFGAMFYSIFAHRKSRGAKPAKFSHNTLAEVIWTVVPTIILIVMAVPSAKALIDMEDTSNAEVTVHITAYQWKWKYEYPKYGVSYMSNLSTPRAQIENKEKKGEHYLLEVDNPLVLPVGKKVRFVVTADDVIHSWWVPALAVKKDAIPGYVNETWTTIKTPGTYRGVCAELCGKDHGFMPIVVNAVSAEEFETWASKEKDKLVKAQQAAAAKTTWSKEDLMARGEKVYAENCAACHGPKGEGVGPFPKMTGSKVANGPAAAHINIVLKGTNKGMPPFARLNDADLAAVITFERNGFGNKGDIVDPAKVKAARQ
jgi:cytochrome c oxidase subunit 2